MRVREILFHNFRSFRGERRISFVDPLTDKVHPVSVLAGSNGSGKTTILETIEALLLYALNPDKPNDLILEARQAGLICLTIEIFQDDFPDTSFLHNSSEIMHIAVGQKELAPEFLKKEKSRILFSYPSQEGSGGKQLLYTTIKGPLLTELSKTILTMQEQSVPMRGGLLFFSHERQLSVTKGGTIEPPPEDRSWVFHFSNADRWKGSLEQLWVWQNYLDLEQSRQKHENLKPFVALVENVLGENRPITISNGRVVVPVAWSNGNGEATKVRLDQLPSGEQQCLLLFGELARHRRKGAVIAIDEIENSLHPTLQRLVMWNLRKVTREWDAQVIVTTHSLEVINTVRGSAFINLDYPKDHYNLPTPAENIEEII